MSEVFHGYDERLDRRVAIKLLRPPSGLLPSVSDSPEAAEILDSIERDRKRFLREIRTTAYLEHPGTPAVYDTGVETALDGSTQIWLVMQLLRGSTLEAIVDGTDYATSAPSVPWAAAITAQIAAVLNDLHRLDVVHRDIKPANVMIVDGGLVKVLDFGIAILRGGSALPRLTQVDRTVGTPAYMSPEQCLGLAVTSASDIYSLGCLLYELLIGDVPFHGTEDVSLRAHHLQSPPPAVRALRPEVPAAVDVLVISMLAKKPEARPGAQVVYETLLPLISMPLPVLGMDDVRDPTRPFRQPLLMMVKRRYESASRIRLTEAEADGLKANVQALLDKDQPAEAIRLLEDGVERAEHGSVMELRLRHYLAAALFYAGEYSRAAPLFEMVGSAYRKHLPSTDSYVLDSFYHAGQAFAEIGQPARALPHLRFFVHNASSAADSGEADQIVESRFVIAQMLWAVGHLEEAVAEFQAIRPLFEKAYGPHSTHIRNLDRQIERLNSSIENAHLRWDNSTL